MPAVQLTPKEKEVLNLLFVGKQAKEVAEALKITEHGVKFHKDALHKKFLASTTTEVIYKALMMGLLQVPIQTSFPFAT